MPLTKVTSSLINTISATQIQTVAADAGKVLTSDGSTLNWVASSSIGGSGASYTTVGNASAGIFASAVCYIPSSAGTGTWTAPAGVYTARVTIVGGGGGATTAAGGRSHFNYPSGSAPGSNQMYANGGAGANTTTGGAAGWNGVNFTAASSGGVAAGGVGGVGGAGNTNPNNASPGSSFGRNGYVYLVNTSAPCAVAVYELYESGGSAGVGGPASGHVGGGTPTLSYAAMQLTNLQTALSQNVGRGRVTSNAGGAGWCSAIVSVTPGNSYAYVVGAGATSASYGMVLIEW